MAQRSVTFPAGNLFQVAAQYLNDATQWYRIAEVNNLVDPFFYGPLNLTIPPADPSGGNGGIYGE